MTNTYNGWFSQVALVVKNLLAKAGDTRDVGSVPGSGRSHGGGHGNPLQYSCLENPMDRGAWWATVTGSQRVRHDWACMHIHLIITATSFPGGSVVKNIFCQCRRHRFDPWFGKMPRRRKWQPTPVVLPGKSHGQGSLVGYSPWGHKESEDMAERLHFCTVLAIFF